MTTNIDLYDLPSLIDAHDDALTLLAERDAEIARLKGELRSVNVRIEGNCAYCNAAEAHWVYKPLCLTCHHWLEAVVKQQKLVITDGQAYSIGKDTDYPRGFGGAHWRVMFANGATVQTRSLWHLGRIPARFAAMLPENATLEQVRVYTTAIPETADDLPF